MNTIPNISPSLFRIWALNQSIGLSLGWFFHSIISHLWTGEHQATLTTAQFIMHNVSLTGCDFIVFYFQNKAIKQLFNFSLIKYMWLYLTMPTIVFWLGYYLIAVPFDILFWLLCLGFFNGIFIAKKLQLIFKWTVWSTLSGLVGFIVAAAILYPFDAYLTSLKGLLSHVVSFTLLGVCAGIPMALFSGYMLRKSILNNSTSI